ncbi:MAG: hypothetical protein ACRCYT_06340, partial [Cetobacterium sp.]
IVMQFDTILDQILQLDNENKNCEILYEILKFLIKNPDQRFGQALFNLGINEFVNKENPGIANHQLRDIYSDSDEEILKRLK